MCKKLYFLISFVLVLCFSSAAWADPIDINNPSFELAADGNRVPDHAGYDGVMAWKENADGAAGFVGVDVQCPYASSTWCHRWPGPTETGSGTDVVYSYIAQTGANAYQVLDANTSGDPNAVIAAGRRYTLTFDAILEDPEDDGNPIKGSLFYPEDVNNPDVAHVELASKTYAVQWVERDLGDCNGESVLDSDNHCPDWNYDLTVKFVAEESTACLGKTLGVKLAAETLDHEAYGFVDNVRLEWDYATSAYEPNPADGGELVSKNPTLTWKPGVWVASTAGHEVYFGTDETAVADANTNTAGIYQTTRDVNNFTPTEPLELGKTYYWKITEVNSGYDGPVPPPWEGDVWSFRVEGHAYDPSPADGETEVAFLGLDLEWAAGAEAENHVVYLGTDEQAVADATTSSPEYKETLTVGTESHPVSGELIAGVTYYWRIDEKSAGGSHIITGDVWSFEAGQFLILDNFNQYPNMEDLYDVWEDYSTQEDPQSDAELGLQTGDMNYIRGGEGKSMQVKFANTSETGTPKYFIGSWVDCQDLTELEAGGDWSIGGVKAMTLYLIGDPCNRPHVGVDKDDNPLVEIIAPWVEVEDTSSNTGWVAYDSPSDMFYDDQWFEWNIDLGIFDACGVTLSAIDRLTIGFGGDRVGQADEPNEDPSHAYVHIDDIRLYPPRCIPEYAREVGNLTEGDCDTDGFDLEVMTRDWVITDMMAQASPPADLGLVRYALDEGTGSIAENDGEFGSDFDLTIGDSFEWDVNGNFTGNLVSNPNNTPTWVDDPCRGWCLYFDGEEGFGRPEEEPTALGGDYLLIPPLNLNLDTVTITAWVYPQPTFGDGDEMMDGFTGIVHQRTHGGGWGIDGSTTAGLSYGSGSGFVYDGSMGYVWNDNASDTWGFETEITIEPLEWNFLAVTIEPSQAVCYRVSRLGVLESATNVLAHDAEEFDFYTGIATDWNGTLRFFKGRISDVRIYGRTLTIGEIMGLGGMSGIVYVPNTSVANISPKDPDLSPDANLWDSYDPNNPDIVNFLDYDLLAKNWLEEYLWPKW